MKLYRRLQTRNGAYSKILLSGLLIARESMQGITLSKRGDSNHLVWRNFRDGVLSLKDNYNCDKTPCDV